MDPARIRGMSIQNVMVREVISVHQNETVREAWVTLMENGISGAPVVDDAGDLVGILSLKDIYNAIVDRVRKARTLREATTQSMDDETKKREETRELSLAMRAVTDGSVGSILPKDQKVWHLGPLDSLERAIKLMAEHSVNRLPIIKEGRVVGIISRQDVILVMAGRK
ncbi:TPA: CBS domain-containing protein [Thermoplasmata archaeon]|nr:CBS domain-containing protein [Thermoplasmata archaeon]